MLPALHFFIPSVLQIQIFISLLLVIKNPAYETNPCNPDIVQVFHLLVMVQSFITNFLIHYNLTTVFSCFSKYCLTIRSNTIVLAITP